MKQWAKKHSKCRRCGRTKYPHKALGYCKNCYDASKGYVWQKKYKEKNADKIKEYQRKRAKILYALGKWGKGQYTTKLMKKLIERDGEVCKKCGKTIDLTIEHIIPRCVGGSNELNNLEILCRSCNIKTYKKLVQKALVFYFREKR